MLGTSVTVRETLDLALIEIIAKGHWTWELRVECMAAVRKALAEQPRVLVLNVAGLVGADSVLASMVLLAEQQCAVQQPPVPLLLVSGEPQRHRLHVTGVARRIAVYTATSEVLNRLAAGPPPPSSARLPLQPTVLAPAAARNLVDDACRAWNLPRLLYPARLIMSELATNALEHAGTPFTASISLRGRDLVHLAVEDGLTRMPRIRLLPRDAAVSLAERGNGLRIVAAAATAWGSNLSARGKVVWATLRFRPDRSATPAPAAPGA